MKFLLTLSIFSHLCFNGVGLIAHLGTACRAKFISAQTTFTRIISNLTFYLGSWIIFFYNSVEELLFGFNPIIIHLFLNELLARAILPTGFLTNRSLILRIMSCFRENSFCYLILCFLNSCFKIGPDSSLRLNDINKFVDFDAH